MVAEIGRTDHQQMGKLDLILETLAGLYISALILPSAVYLISDKMSNKGLLLILVTGLVLGLIGARWIIRWETAIEWLGTSGFAWFIPLIGWVPVVIYMDEFVLFLGVALTSLSPDEATLTIGATGFILGFFATLLGTAVIVVARRRRISHLVDNVDVTAVWKAGWTRQRTVLLLGGVGVPIVIGIGFIDWVWQRELVASTLPILFPLILLLGSLTNERNYRVTSVGLIQETPLSTRLLSWSEFEGFSMTDEEIIIHRRSPCLDIRFSRRDIAGDENTIVTALEDHLSQDY